MLAISSFAQDQPAKPFSKDDVLQLLKGSVPPKRVGELAQKRGIDFQVTPEAETEFRQAGANDELLATLRALSPTARLQIKSTPGGAHVYLDDEPVGTTSVEGRLILSLKPGTHHIRFSLDGYKDYVEEVRPEAGTASVPKLTYLRVTLEPARMAATVTSNSNPTRNLSLGVWKLNEAKSLIPIGVSKNSTITFSPISDDMIKVTTDGLDAWGTPIHTEWTGRFDEKPYQLLGDPYADERAYKFKSERTLYLANMKGGKTVSNGKIEFYDGKSCTIEMDYLSPKRFKAKYVYDKQ
jgi:hypothetical protein